MAERENQVLLIGVGTPAKPWTEIHGEQSFSVRMGRGGECELQVPQEVDASVRRTISRQHARLYRHEGRLWLEDLDSRNFTFLNDRVVFAPVPVELPCVVRLGAAVLHLSLGPGGQPSQGGGKAPGDKASLSSTIAIDETGFSCLYRNEYREFIRDQIHWAEALVDVVELTGRHRRAEDLEKQLREVFARHLGAKKVRLAWNVRVDRLDEAFPAGTAPTEGLASLSGQMRKGGGQRKTYRVEVDGGRGIIWAVTGFAGEEGVCALVYAQLGATQFGRPNTREAEAIVTMAVCLARPFIITLTDLEQCKAALPASVSRMPSEAMRQACQEAGFWGASAPFQKTLYLAEMAATRFLGAFEGEVRLSAVFLTGESGTGKSKLARLIHDRSNHAKGTFLELNCAAVPVTLAESELFGFERGAHDKAFNAKPGMFELCHDGTLFLDEIGKTSLDFQSKLLTVIDSGTYMRLGGVQAKKSRCHLLLATSEDPAKLCEEGRLLNELWYRVGALTVILPPLRERPDDISVLIGEKLAVLNQSVPTEWQKHLSPQVHSLLCAYAWPGNLRELMQCIEVAHALTPPDAREIDIESLPETIRRNMGVKAAAPIAAGFAPDLTRPLDEQIAALERHYLAGLLGEAEGNLTEVARRAGKSYPTIHGRFKQMRAWVATAPEEEVNRLRALAGDFWHVIDRGLDREEDGDVG
jgi:DNA-binding NtrC family response regulator